MTKNRTGIIVLVAVVLVVGIGALVVNRSNDDSDDTGRVKTATEPFKQLSAAEAAGYKVLADKDGLTCIDDPGGAGAMGTHLVNGDVVGDGVIDADHPEALLYDRDHHDQLLGVEYVVLQKQWKGDQPPTLFGQQFALTNTPNRFGLDPYYSLHAWIWKDNPKGRFTNWNPDVGCRQPEQSSAPRHPAHVQ